MEEVVGTVLVFFLSCVSAAAGHCERSASRIVQNAIKTDLLPVYESLGVPVPRDCLFNLGQSRFYEQEELKYREHPTKYVCLVCGKSFYEERYIDQHMYHRHQHLENREVQAVCLADYCHVFRCDVISGQENARYWDKALCKDSTFQEARQTCQKIQEACIDTSLDEKNHKAIKDLIEGRLCQYLVCDKYWVIPSFDVHPVNTALYVMAFMFLCIGLMIYYYVAYTHFYTDDSLLDSFHDRPEQRPVRYPRMPNYNNLRYRAANR